MSETKEILNNDIEEVKEEVKAETTEEVAKEKVKLLSPKQMKIFGAVLIVAVIGLIALLSTSGSIGASSVEGTWVLTEVVSSEGTLVGEELELAYGGPVEYHLNEEGKLVIEMIGQEFTGEWIQKGNAVELMYNGGTTELNYEDPVMTMGDEETKYILELE